jgi:DNA polymerase I-like protein with 3'-5' exonuclease and polymerase domains
VLQVQEQKSHAPPHQQAVLRSDSKLPDFLTDLTVYHKQPYLVLDFETTNKEFGSPLNPDNRIVLACWTLHDPDGTVRSKKHHFGGEYDQQELVEDVQRYRFIVAHNAKFELGWLRRMGVDLRSILAWDTMLGAWVDRGNLRTPINLDDLSVSLGLPRKLGTVTNLIDLGVPVEDIPSEWLLDYCHHDVWLASQLFIHYRKKLTDDGRLHLWHVRNLTCGALTDIEAVGMTLDPDRVFGEYQEQLRLKTEADLEMKLLYGDVLFTSDKQLRKLLYEDLKFPPPKDRWGKPLLTAVAKQPVVDLDSVLSLKATNKKQRRFLELYEQFNQADSRLSKTLNFFKGVCEERGGRFFGQFNQGITATHRLSSSGRKVHLRSIGKEAGVQFQNLPREYKPFFTASSPGRVIGECDSSQLEFRMAAELCRDEVALADIRAKKDVHAETARILTENGEPTERQDAKPNTFRPLFGGQSGSDAVKAYNRYFCERYKGIADEQRKWTYKVLKDKKLVTAFGMHYFWPNCSMAKSGYVSHTTEIYNYPIQGSATAELMPVALVYLWYRSAETSIVLLNTIHDSIVSELDETDTELYIELCKQVMTKDVLDYFNRVYRYRFVCPLGTEVKVGTHWSEAQVKVEFDVALTDEGDYLVRTKRDGNISERIEV